MAERMRRITAVSVLMSDEYDISDGLYAELVVLLEALQGEDLKHTDTYTCQETALKYLEDYKVSIEVLVGEVEDLTRTIAAWPAENTEAARNG